MVYSNNLNVWYQQYSHRKLKEHLKGFLITCFPHRRINDMSPDQTKTVVDLNAPHFSMFIAHGTFFPLKLYLRQLLLLGCLNPNNLQNKTTISRCCCAILTLSCNCPLNNMETELLLQVMLQSHIVLIFHTVFHHYVLCLTTAAFPTARIGFCLLS